MTTTGGDPAAAIARFFDPVPDAPIGIAVSGGSDSLALMHLLADWAGTTGAQLYAVTVDHGLRPEAATEAAQVARQAADLDIPHTTLRWTGWDGRGNLPDQARRARYALMADWARDHGITQIALGHTADDQAETLLMRLARGAGVDGLGAMSTRRSQGGVAFVRPLLSERRDVLRAYLTARGLSWIDDPTNDDAAFDRVKARQALHLLEPLGLTTPALTTVAANLASLRDTLSHYARVEADRIVTVEAGDLLMPQMAFDALPPEIARRILQAALRWTSGTEYPPRRTALLNLIDALSRGGGGPLSGCLVTVKSGTIRVSREPTAVKDLRADPRTPWDGRWQIAGPFASEDHIAATGEAGLKACPDWRDTGLPRRTLLAAPAVWRGETLIAAPLAGYSNGFSAKLCRNREDFLTMLNVH